MEKKKGILLHVLNVLKRAVIYVELIIVAIVVIYPLIWLVGTSLNAVKGIARINPIPDKVTLANYIRLIKETSYVRWFLNTGYVAVLTMIFAVLINTVSAFIFARFRFKGKKASLLTIMLLQIFPCFMAVTAYYMIALTFDMLNNLNMLVIIYVATSIPSNIWLVKGNLMNLSKSIDEAAYIDGATKLQVFWKIIFPLSLPIITFVALTAFMTPWMDYMIPRFLINKTDLMTIAPGLYEMVRPSKGNNDFTAFSAGAVLIAIPITVLYMIGQKYLITGLSSGANKGE